MAFIDSLVAVIPMLGLLIVVHELGHFLVAKAVGVRVLKFSVGFGAPIGIGKLRLRWERNGTEYVIGWIPLGGFVRMLGEPYPGDSEVGPPIPEDARDDEFLERKPVWQRLCVVFAGPAMNLLLPVVCLIGILWNGIDRPDAVVGMVDAGSPAAIAGIAPGDRILSVDGAPVQHYGEAITPIREHEPGESLVLEVEREGERLSLDVAVASQEVRDGFGGNEEIGWIGLSHDRRDARVALPDPASKAGRAGLRSGDRVLAVDGAEVDGWEALEAAHRGAAGRLVSWKIERPQPLDDAAVARLATGERSESQTDELSLAIPRSRDLAALGIVPATILVGSVVEGKPAARAGLRRDDLILAVDGEPVGSFRSFVALIQTSRGRELELTYAREGALRTTRLRAEEELVEGRYDIEAMAQKIYRIGLAPQPSLLAGPVFEQKVRNPLESIPEAVAMTWNMTARYLEGLSRVLDGAVGADQISGPIGIARIARHSLDRGFEEYLFWIMLISINLGILNLLPIPILDGGQALIYSIEGIMRSPLSMRAREIANSFGFAVLVILMSRAFWNDLTPFWSRFVDWLSGTAP